MARLMQDWCSYRKSYDEAQLANVCIQFRASRAKPVSAKHAAKDSIIATGILAMYDWLFQHFT